MRSIELYVIGLILPDLKIQLNLNELLLINVKLGFGAKCHQNVILFLQSSTYYYHHIPSHNFPTLY